MKYKKKQEILIEGSLIIAPLKRRIFSIIIDFAILIVIFILTAKIIERLGFDLKRVVITGFTHVEVESDISKPAETIIKILYPAISLLYFTLTTYFLKGQTLGKKILRIRVVSLYDERIHFWHCLERSLGYVASSLELGLGFVQAAWNQNRMALHDKIAGTIVIYTEKKKIIHGQHK